MLASLTIRDVVLIDQVKIDLGQGLNVLTGETGAGKSILLDSLGLALGMRSDRSLVRSGADQGSVIAEFTLNSNSPLIASLQSEGLDAGDGYVILRRLVTKDGKSRAWINDQPISVTLLKHIGEQLVEIHGQHAERGLLEVSAHRGLLDQFAGNSGLLDTVRGKHAVLEEARANLARVQENYENARADEEWLRHAVEEIDTLAPIEGEEKELADRRALMMQGERLRGELSGMLTSLNGHKGAEDALNSVLRKLGRMDNEAQTLLEPVIGALERASVELSDGTQQLETIHRGMDFNGQDLEETEERLFDLRALARKHNVLVDELPALLARLQDRLDAVNNGDAMVQAAQVALTKAEDAMSAAVEALHQARKNAATELDQAVMTELPPLKLEKAQFRTRVEALPADQWSASGGDKIIFEICTNPGSPFGPMVKVASGGEMARFVLALKVVLARRGGAPVLIFDEVDQGIGGATADAVGERLKRIAGGAQVMVVTHSPQVAARGDHHFKIRKTVYDEDGQDYTRTSVSGLSATDKRDEIARMLAGAEITNEALAAADQLLNAE